MNNFNKIWADIATVKIGNLEIEGLYCQELDQFGIGVSQICSLFQILNKNAVRDIKTLLGKDFQFLKCRSKLHPKAVNVILLPEFEKLLMLQENLFIPTKGTSKNIE